jgi:hypothetical protein
MHSPPQHISKRDHRSPFPFYPRNQVCAFHPSTAASHVDAMPYRWAMPQHSTVRLSTPARRQQRANAKVDVTLASTYLRYHYQQPPPPSARLWWNDRHGKVPRYEIGDIRAATPRPLIPIGAAASSRYGQRRGFFVRFAVGDQRRMCEWGL